MAEALLITRSDLVRFTTVNGNVDTDKFIQYISIAQAIHIQNYLGTDLLNKIKADIIATTLTGNYETLVETYIKQMLIHWAMVEYLPFAAYTIANGGVFKHSAENSVNVEKTEIDFLIQKERDFAEYYTQRFVDYMSFNAPSSFPEYYDNSNEEIYPDKDVIFSGWVL